MRRHRNALIGALVWWFGTRYAKRRAARALSAVPGVGGSGAATRSRLGALGGVLVVAGVLAAALVARRKLRGSGEPGGSAAAPTQPTEMPAAADTAP